MWARVNITASSPLITTTAIEGGSTYLAIASNACRAAANCARGERSATWLMTRQAAGAPPKPIEATSCSIFVASRQERGLFMGRASTLTSPQGRSCQRSAIVAARGEAMEDGPRRATPEAR